MWWERKSEGKVIYIAVFLANAKEKGEEYPRPWSLDVYKSRLKWYRKIKAEKDRREKNERIKRMYDLKGPNK